MGRSLGVGHGNLLLCSCRENAMDRGAWQATIHGVTKELDMTEQLNTHIVTSQCYASFYCKEKWISYMYTNPIFSGFLSPLDHHRALSRDSCAIQYTILIYFIYCINNIYMSIPISQFIPPPPSPLGIHMFLFYFCTVNKIVYTNFFRFHIYVLIYGICFCLSGLLHSVWESLDASTSLQMTQFHSFLWLSSIPCVYITSSLSIPLLMHIWVVSISSLL